MKSVLVSFAMVFTLAACASSEGGRAARSAAVGASDGGMITVDGLVTVRGNEPLTTLVLETAESNKYVLTVEGEMRDQIQNAYPSRCRVTGTVYSDKWAGKAYAHLKVVEWETVE